MDLQRVNSHLLDQICLRLNLPPYSEINSAFCEGVCRKLNFKHSSDDCTSRDLVSGLSRLGLDLSHVNVRKVEEKDTLHTYLLLDILSVLIESKSAATKNNIQRLVDNNGQQIHPQAFSLESEKHPTKTISDQALPKVAPRIFSLEDDKGGTTSGGEEVSKILQEAERKYGQVKAFRKNIAKEDFSAIASGPSTVDSKKWGKENISMIQKIPSVDQKRNVKTKENRKNEMVGRSKQKEVGKTSSNKPLIDVTRSAGENSENTIEVDNDGKVDTVLGASDDVIIKIPQAGGADVEVKVKSLEGKSMKNRRIHVRVHEDSAPTPKRIKYGRKAVLAHHLRKNRSPMFSKKPKPLTPAKKEVMERVAVELRKKRKHQEIEKEDLRVGENIRDAKTSLECKLKTQKFVRESRTRTAQLRKLAANVP